MYKNTNEVSTGQSLGISLTAKSQLSLVSLNTSVGYGEQYNYVEKKNIWTLDGH